MAFYPCPLFAMADGWKLLAPPTDISFKNSDGENVPCFEWFFVKD